MNHRRWSNENVPMLALTTKLSEEAAEVGTEFTDQYVNGKKVDPKQVREELDHVRFLCDVIENRLPREAK